MDDLLAIYHKYDDSEYDIADVERMIAYTAIPNIDEEYITNISNQLELMRFTIEESEQKQKVLAILRELIIECYLRNSQ
ncbi:MAG: hypothetical protein MJ172_06615 [Clostridia bacterium]|nr:hypothetical protein [Clostridia bacterium]